MQHAKNDKRSRGYLLLLASAVWAAIAVDRLFFHVDRGFGWFTAAIGGGFLARGAWLLRQSRS
jgi:hypothetical protein